MAKRIPNKIKKIAEEIWKLESQFMEDASNKTAFKEMSKIARTLSPEELLLVDEYITEHYGNAV